MFQITQFNAMIAEKGYNKTKLAKEMGITRNTLLRKLDRQGDFNKDELQALINIFGLDKVIKVFFTNSVA